MGRKSLIKQKKSLNQVDEKVMNVKQFIVGSFNAWIMTKNWWKEIENICEYSDVLCIKIAGKSLPRVGILT
jgi:hypothetical protein